MKSTTRVWLHVPAGICPYPSDHDGDADDTYPACLSPTARLSVVVGHRPGA